MPTAAKQQKRRIARQLVRGKEKFNCGTLKPIRVDSLSWASNTSDIFSSRAQLVFMSARVYDLSKNGKLRPKWTFDSQMGPN